MQIVEMLSRVEQAIQSVASNKFTLFTEEEKIDALNLAQERFIEENVKNIIESKIGYENNGKSVHNVRSLIKSHYRIPALIPHQNGVAPDGDMYRKNMFYGVLPQNFMYLLSDESVINYAQGANCDDSDTICSQDFAYKEYIAVVPYRQLVNDSCVDSPDFRIRYKNKWNGIDFTNDDLVFDLADYPEIGGITQESDKHLIINLVLEVLNRTNSTPEWTNASFGSSFNSSYDTQEFGLFQPKKGRINVYWETYRDRYFKDSFVFVTDQALEVMASGNMVVNNAVAIGSGSTLGGLEIYGRGFTGVNVNGSNISIGGQLLSSVGGSNLTVTDSQITIPADKLLLLQAVIGAGSYEIVVTNGALNQRIRFYYLAAPSGTNPFNNVIGTFTNPLSINGTYTGIFVQVEVGNSEPTFSGASNIKTYTYNEQVGTEGARGQFYEFNFIKGYICSEVAPSRFREETHDNRFLKTEVISRSLDSEVNKPTKDRPLSTISNDTFLFVYTDGSFIVKEIMLSYIKRPRKMSLASSQSCELPEFAHQEIIDRAVSYILLSTKDPAWQGKLQDIQNN
jgi:hypothetical protein